MVLVFFVYGLAFFTMGLAVTLESRRASGLRLAQYLPWLGAFGLVQGIVAWMDMAQAIPRDSPAPPTFAPFHRIQPVNCLSCHQVVGTVATDVALDASSLWDATRLVLLVAAGLCLIHFGAGLAATPSQPRRRGLTSLPWILGALWLVSLIGARLLSGEGNWVWLTAGGILARYFLHLPGSVLAGLALSSQRPLFADLGLPRIGRDSAWAAVCFALYAIVSGLVVPPAPFWPASLLNYASFFAVAGIPVQVVRAVAGLGITFFVIRTLRFFEAEYQRRLDGAKQEQIAAQERARSQLELWNRELEARVEERSAEIERRNRELAIMEERERLAHEMHDSLGQTLGYLNLKVLSLRTALAGGDQAGSQVALDALEDGVQDMSREVRESLQNLRAKVPSEGGLLAALESLLVRFGDQTGIAAGLLNENGHETIRIEPEAELQLLRIVQEALSNVRKHAEAHHVWVRLSRAGGTAVVAVEDDGRGFDPLVPKDSEQRFGLQTMQERAKAVGGEVRVESQLGSGTRVIVSLPLAQRWSGGGEDDAEE